jgi:hypothetical protein
MKRAKDVAVGKTCIRRGVIFIPRDGTFEEPLRLARVGAAPIQNLPAAQVEIVGIDVVRRESLDVLAAAAAEKDLQLFTNGAGQLDLHREQILGVTLEGLRP